MLSDIRDVWFEETSEKQQNDFENNYSNFPKVEGFQIVLRFVLLLN